MLILKTGDRNVIKTPRFGSSTFPLGTTVEISLMKDGGNAFAVSLIFRNGRVDQRISFVDYLAQDHLPEFFASSNHLDPEYDGTCLIFAIAAAKLAKLKVFKKADHLDLELQIGTYWSCAHVPINSLKLFPRAA